MKDKVFVARYLDGSERVLGDAGEWAGEPYVEGRWVDFADPVVKEAEWGAWIAEEIPES